MSMISDKVAYLKGLAEGLKIDDSTNEGKLLTSILDVLSDIAFDLEDNMDAVEELECHIENINNDLDELEEFVYDDDCGCDDCDCDDDYDCDCNDTTEVKYITVECPHCKKETSFDIGIFDENTEYVECPNCHERIEVVYEDEDDDGDCKCHCDK